MNKTGATCWQTVPVTGVEGGRGSGWWTWRERFAAVAGIGQPGEWDYTYSAKLATGRSIDDHAFMPVDSRLAAIPPLPDGWDPTERTC